MPSVIHCTDQYLNNRAEVSHPDPTTRAPDARLQVGDQLQRFASVHGVVQTSFGSADTFCGQSTTACSERGRSSNGMR
jgi:hypothetical protein